jgi:hypothetical protein
VAHNVCSNNAVCFAAQNDVPEAAINDSFLAAKGTYQHAAKQMERAQLFLEVSFNIAISNERASLLLLLAAVPVARILSQPRQAVGTYIPKLIVA